MSMQLESRQSLIVDHLPLVERIAGRYARRPAELEELRQAGCLALVHAAWRHRSEEGEFSHYAAVYIKGAILAHLRTERRQRTVALEPEAQGGGWSRTDVLLGRLLEQLDTGREELPLTFDPIQQVARDTAELARLAGAPVDRPRLARRALRHLDQALRPGLERSGARERRLLKSYVGLVVCWELLGLAPRRIDIVALERRHWLLPYLAAMQPAGGRRAGQVRLLFPLACLDAAAAGCELALLRPAALEDIGLDCERLERRLFALDDSRGHSRLSERLLRLPYRPDAFRRAICRFRRLAGVVWKAWGGIAESRIRGEPRLVRQVLRRLAALRARRLDP